MAGAPKGNKNAAGPRDRIISDAIRRVLLAEDGKKLRKLAEAMVDRAIEGDTAAAKEVHDRGEGKVAQPVTGPDGGPIQIAEVPWLTGRSL